MRSVALISLLCSSDLLRLDSWHPFAQRELPSALRQAVSLQ